MVAPLADKHLAGSQFQVLDQPLPISHHSASPGVGMSVNPPTDPTTPNLSKNPMHRKLPNPHWSWVTAELSTFWRRQQCSINHLTTATTFGCELSSCLGSIGPMSHLDGWSSPFRPVPRPFSTPLGRTHINCMNLGAGKGNIDQSRS